MAVTSIYAPSRIVTDLDECTFYHTMDIPGYGVVQGDWDLREGVHDYLAGVEFSGKRVLEIGTASGFLCFHMEQQGADVVAYDLGEDQNWDVVPYVGHDHGWLSGDFKQSIKRLNNSWWLSHRAFNSKARVVYGTVYDIPADIGAVDITTFGCVLQHLRDPFLALYQGLKLTKETAIITESFRSGRRFKIAQALVKKFVGPHMEIAFLPDHHQGKPKDTWWFLTPDIVKRFLGVLGFEVKAVTFHTQRWRNKKFDLYTVVGQRIQKT